VAKGERLAGGHGVEQEHLDERAVGRVLDGEADLDGTGSSDPASWPWTRYSFSLRTTRSALRSQTPRANPPAALGFAQALAQLADGVVGSASVEPPKPVERPHGRWVARSLGPSIGLLSG